MAIGALFHFVQLAVLARLLSPADFGMMAVVVAVISFIKIFSDLGVSSAIIHYQEVSQNQLSTLFWLNTLVGVSLVLILISSSSLISDSIFDEPELEPILVLMSLSIMLTALGQQIRVMAEKGLRFAVLAKIEVLSSVAGVSSALTWAMFSPTVYAFVAGFIINEALKCLLLWLFARDGWLPGFFFKVTEISDFLRFGAYIMANNLVNSINQQADIIMAGRVASLDNLGLYSLPRTLSLKVAGIINPVITRVGFPVMAQAQKDGHLLKLVYLKATNMTASVNSPIYIGLCFLSEDVVQFMFGEQWKASAQLLSILALWGLLRSFGNPVGSLLLAVGRADLSFKWNFALLIVIIPVLWFALNWDVQGLAIGQLSLMILLIIPGWYFLVRPHCGATLFEYTKSFLIPSGCTAVAFILGGFVASDISDNFLRFAITISISIGIYILLSVIFNRQWVLAMWKLVSVR